MKHRQATIEILKLDLHRYVLIVPVFLCVFSVFYENDENHPTNASPLWYLVWKPYSGFFLRPGMYFNDNGDGGVYEYAWLIILVVSLSCCILMKHFLLFEYMDHCLKLLSEVTVQRLFTIFIYFKWDNSLSTHSQYGLCFPKKERYIVPAHSLKTE